MAALCFDSFSSVSLVGFWFVQYCREGTDAECGDVAVVGSSFRSCPKNIEEHGPTNGLARLVCYHLTLRHGARSTVETGSISKHYDAY